MWLAFYSHGNKAKLQTKSGGAHQKSYKAYFEQFCSDKKTYFEQIYEKAYFKQFCHNYDSCFDYIFYNEKAFFD